MQETNITNNDTIPANISRQFYEQITILILIMFISFIGNITVIVIVLMHENRKKQQSPINMFVLNLAFGDLAVCCLCMSAELFNHLSNQWTLGNIMCKLVMYVEVTTLMSSVFLILGMAYDRYIAICHPMKFANSKIRAKRIIIVAWIMASTVAVPQWVVFCEVQISGFNHTEEPKYACKSAGYTAEWQRPVYFLCQTFLVLIFPSIFISYCYINVARVVWRQGNPIITVKSSPRKNKIINSNHLPDFKKRVLRWKNGKTVEDFVDKNYSESLSYENYSKEPKTNNYSSHENLSLRKTDKQCEQFFKAKIRSIKLTFCIIVSFVGCWTPYFLVTNIQIFNNNKLTNNQDTDYIISMVVNNIALLNSALNPFIYGYFSLNLMEKFSSRTSLKDKITTTLRHESSQNESQETNLPDSSTEEKKIIAKNQITFV